MGNNLGVNAEIEYVINGETELNPRDFLRMLENTFGHVTVTRNTRTNSREPPFIRKMPDIRKFLTTDLYKEIKSNCGLPPTSKLPYDHFSLVRALQRREHGLSAIRSNSFTVNQQRSIANLYIPNQKEARLMSLESKVYTCKFNKDGSKLLITCHDGCVRIYDSSKGTYHLVNRINGRYVTWSILDTDISPCGQYFAYCTWGKSIMMFPMNGKDEDCKIVDLNSPYDRFAIFSLRYSPCGTKIIGGSNHTTIYVADIERREVEVLHTHNYPTVDINAVSYVCDKDPNVIICGCDDGSLKLYDLRSSIRRYNTAKSVANFYGHYDGVTYIDPRNDGYHVLSNSKDQSIKIWDLRKPSPSFRRSPRAFQEMPEWDYRWDQVPHSFYNPRKPLENDTSIMTYRGHRVSKTLLRAKFSPALQTGQRFIYTGCATGRIVIYDVLTGHIKEAIEGHKNVLRDLDWHPMRSEIVSGSWDSHIHLNTYNRNAALSKSQNIRRRPVRRSRRLAERHDKPDTHDAPTTSESIVDDRIARDTEGLIFSATRLPKK